MTRLLLAMGLIFTMSDLQAATLSKTIIQYSIGGVSIEEIEQELRLRGPQVGSGAIRHPGATRMEFKTRVSYSQTGDRCSISKVAVTVLAKITLPRWTRRKSAAAETRLIWDTLAADIKRHEESHVVIAMNHARELEMALLAIQPQRSCDAAQNKVNQISEQILAKHSAEQDRFDHIEGKNFNSRLLRLLQYRRERVEDGSLARP